MTPKIISSPKPNVARNDVLKIADITTRIKEIIVHDVTFGISKEETERKIAELVTSFNISETDNQYNLDTRRSLFISAQKWYYQYSVNTRVLNTALIQNFQNLIVNYQRGTGLTQTNRTYTIDLNALINELTTSNQPIRTTIDHFRGTLGDGRNNAAVLISDYDKKVKQQIRILASDPPKSNRLTRDGKPYKVSLRNRAEMKVRYEANMEDIARLSTEGVNLVWTSSHPDASPRCAPYQGRLWSLDGKSGVVDGTSYQPIDLALSGPLGDGNGIISGYNCRHTLIPYSPGSKAPSDYSSAEIRKEYAINNRQRQYENNIRNLKLEERLLRSYGDTQTASQYRKRWQNLTRNYQAYSLENGRAYYPWRTRITSNEEDFYND